MSGQTGRTAFQNGPYGRSKRPIRQRQTACFAMCCLPVGCAAGTPAACRTCQCASGRGVNAKEKGGWLMRIAQNLLWRENHAAVRRADAMAQSPCRGGPHSRLAGLPFVYEICTLLPHLRVFPGPSPDVGATIIPHIFILGACLGRPNGPKMVLLNKCLVK